MSDPLLQFDLNLLLAFDALMSTRSVTQAAEQICVSQSATSHMLARLRRALGDPLFVKRGNQMVPTARAESMRSEVRDALGLMRATLSTAGSFDPTTSHREFRLCVPEYFEVILLPPLLDHLRSAAPNVKFTIDAMIDAVPVEEMARGAVDAVVGVRGEQEMPLGLHTARLCNDGYVGLTRRGHPHARDNVSLDQYLEYTHVQPYSVIPSQSLIDDWLTSQKLKRRTIIRSQSYVSAVSILKATDHIMVLPSRVAAMLAAGFDLRPIALPRGFPRLELSYLRHPASMRDPAKRWLRDEIFSAAKVIESRRSQELRNRPSQPSSQLAGPITHLMKSRGDRRRTAG